jgi:hypothetical protein
MNGYLIGDAEGCLAQIGAILGPHRNKIKFLILFGGLGKEVSFGT